MDRRLIQHINLDTGVVVLEEYRRGECTYKRSQRLHRDPKEGPALTTRVAETGDVIYQEYRVHGRIHRADGPAVTYWEYGTAESDRIDEYWRRGRHHRDPREGPAVIRRDADTGRLISETYYRHGLEHRDQAEGPADITYDRATGRVTREAYYCDGEYDRDAEIGPAVIFRDSATGTVIKELYMENGKPVPSRMSACASSRECPASYAPSRPPSRRPRRPGRDRSP